MGRGGGWGGVEGGEGWRVGGVEGGEGWRVGRGGGWGGVEDGEGMEGGDLHLASGSNKSISSSHFYLQMGTYFQPEYRPLIPKPVWR